MASRQSVCALRDERDFRVKSPPTRAGDCGLSRTPFSANDSRVLFVRSRSSLMSKIVQDTPAPPPPTGTQFLPSLPAPLTIALVALAPQIHFVRWILEAGSWRADWEDSWLLLAAWWGMCLAVRAVFRYVCT